MFVLAIETCGRTVAYTKEVDRIMLDGILNGGRQEEALKLREGLLCLRSWDGVSPLTARLATESEDLEFHKNVPENEPDAESFFTFPISMDGEGDVHNQLDTRPDCYAYRVPPGLLVRTVRYCATTKAASKATP
jgi:hypothetical protein